MDSEEAASKIAAIQKGKNARRELQEEGAAAAAAEAAAEAAASSPADEPSGSGSGGGGEHRLAGGPSADRTLSLQIGRACAS